MMNYYLIGLIVLYSCTAGAAETSSSAVITRTVELLETITVHSLTAENTIVNLGEPDKAAANALTDLLEIERLVGMTIQHLTKAGAADASNHKHIPGLHALYYALASRTCDKEEKRRYLLAITEQQSSATAHKVAAECDLAALDFDAGSTVSAIQHLSNAYPLANEFLTINGRADYYFFLGTRKLATLLLKHPECQALMTPVENRHKKVAAYVRDDMSTKFKDEELILGGSINPLQFSSVANKWCKILQGGVQPWKYRNSSRTCTFIDTADRDVYLAAQLERYAVAHALEICNRPGNCIERFGERDSEDSGRKRQ